MRVGEEIERKFLVEDSFEAEERKIENKIKIKQAYVSLDPERIVRVRIINDKKAILTIKSKKNDLARFEFEYKIPLSEGEELIDHVAYKPYIRKTRYKIRSKGKDWEIDYFTGKNKGLVLAEVELDQEDEDLERPDFIKEEVTDDKRYYNFYLVKEPYNKWSN